MKIKLLISILSVIIISTTLTLVLVYYPYDNNNQYVPDPDRFSSITIREVPNENFLPMLYYFENLTGDAIYFEDLDNDSRDMIHNITYYIERELKFLEEFEPTEFATNSWRHHNFTYIGKLTLEVNKENFLSMFNLTNLYPYFMFYYNFSSFDYCSNSTITTGYNPHDWLLSDLVDYIYSINSNYILITQHVAITDIYAPLAGTGTEFERQILCLETGQPVFFLSDEGPWWIS